MENKELIGKWIAVEPILERGNRLSRTQILIVVKETKKQVVARENEGGFDYRQTIPKTRIMCVVPECDVKTLRAEAKDIGNEFYEKRKDLRDTYLSKMKGIVGENF